MMFRKLILLLLCSLYSHVIVGQTAPVTDDGPGKSLPAHRAPTSGGAPYRTGSLDYLHILSTGQSLAQGAFATPVRSATQPYSNLMLGVAPWNTVGSLNPLHEVDQESPSSGMANMLFVTDPQQRSVIVGLHALSATTYNDLKKGTTNWAGAMSQVSATRSAVLAMGGGATYVPTCVTVVHGESDNNLGNAPLYQGFLEEWQRDYETDVSAIVGVPVALPMFVSQMSTGFSGEMAQAQYQAHLDNPGKIILIGPKYQYGYHTDNLHLRNIDSQHLGEMFAKVIHHVVYEGQVWNPLMPTGVYRNGNVILIDYDIPVGTLVIDTMTVARRENLGFEFVQNGGNTVAITSVGLTNGNTRVEILLDSIPTGTDQRVRYAYTCPRGGAGFPRCGAAADSTTVGGNIRDSDNSVSAAIGSTGLPLHDWSVTFDAPVLGPLGGDAALDRERLSIYPNPAKNVLQVRLQQADGPILAITLCDLSGRALVRLTDATVLDWVDIDCSALPRGLYLLHAEFADGATLSRRVVLQ